MTLLDDRTAGIIFHNRTLRIHTLIETSIKTTLVFGHQWMVVLSDAYLVTTKTRSTSAAVLYSGLFYPVCSILCVSNQIHDYSSCFPLSNSVFIGDSKRQASKNGNEYATRWITCVSTENIVPTWTAVTNTPSNTLKHSQTHFQTPLQVHVKTHSQGHFPKHVWSHFLQITPCSQHQCCVNKDTKAVFGLQTLTSTPV